jgi:hypothetical protein
MTRLPVGVAVALLAVLVPPTSAAAHRLDEYLQATRVSLDRDRVRLEIDLTPGVAIARDVLRLVDRDSDGAISPEELRAYGERVIADVSLDVDGRTLAVHLTRADAPALDEMTAGMGAIRLQAETTVVKIGAGLRRVRVHNVHEPAPSVYLANALVSNDPAVTVLRQTRDARQQEIRVDYEVALNPAARLIWLGVALTSLVTFIGIRRRGAASLLLDHRRRHRYPAPAITQSAHPSCLPSLRDADPPQQDGD